MASVESGSVITISAFPALRLLSAVGRTNQLTLWLLKGKRPKINFVGSLRRGKMPTCACTSAFCPSSLLSGTAEASVSLKTADFSLKQFSVF